MHNAVHPFCVLRSKSVFCRYTVDTAGEEITDNFFHATGGQAKPAIRVELDQTKNVRMHCPEQVKTKDQQCFTASCVPQPLLQHSKLAITAVGDVTCAACAVCTLCTGHCCKVVDVLQTARYTDNGKGLGPDCAAVVVDVTSRGTASKQQGENRDLV